MEPVVRRKVCQIGCGAIGKVIARAIDQEQAGACQLSGLWDCDKERSQRLARELQYSPQIFSSFETLLHSDGDLVIESASQEALSQYGEQVLMAGKDLMAMSIGALVDPMLLQQLNRAALQTGRKIYLPSGALCGLDGVKGATQSNIEKVQLTTTKHPQCFSKVEYLRQQGVDLKKIIQPTILFEGPAQKAAKLFPRNINVSATLALAGIGPEKTMVKIIADPSVTGNIHRVKVSGDFGTLTAETRNVLSPDNPKTSYLAALSAVATLYKITSPLQIGT